MATMKRKASYTESATRNKSVIKRHRQDVKQHVAEDSEFVILARDNNKPDPYGICSITAGPLTWPQVSVLFNARYGKNVGPAAMEKRSRLNRRRYYEEHPDYPRAIMYARNGTAVESVELASGSSESEKTLFGFQAAKSEAIGDCVSWKNGYGACKPPSVHTQAADIQYYFDQRLPIQQDEYPDILVLEVVDETEKVVGSCEIPMKDIRNSSKVYARILLEFTSVDCSVHGASIETISRYISCISPAQQWKLPSSVNWDFRTSSELYIVATQLEDSWVRRLIMEHWCGLRRQEVELHIDPSDLNNLFKNTDMRDEAQIFWYQTMWENGITLENIT